MSALRYPMAVAAACCALAASSAPAAAQTNTMSARDVLTQASFGSATKQAAMQGVLTAQRLAAAALARSPTDHEALLMQATAKGYEAKLSGSRADAIAARKLFEALARRSPRDAEPQLGLGAWHMGAVFKLGSLMGRAALGAQKAVGLAALDRAVALGGDRASCPGVAALLRLEQDPGDQRGRALAEMAARASTPTAFDRAMRRASTAVLASLNGGDAAATKKLAARLLPFGQFGD